VAGGQGDLVRLEEIATARVRSGKCGIGSRRIQGSNKGHLYNCFFAIGNLRDT